MGVNQTLGANWLAGDLAEFMVFDYALSDAELRAAECYLSAKYGIPVA